MGVWKFSETKLMEDYNFNPILERFYTYGISGLVRENIQNSLDHRLDKRKPVEVVIELGKLNGNDIPGFDEIKNRIKALMGTNQYSKETIDNMKAHLNDRSYDFISFEDKNTKGLSGSNFGYSVSGKYSYSAYAYSKGIHFEDSDKVNEKLRGGSHGIGKIASNAASILYTMFFANCDEYSNETLGGTIQLIDHQLDGKTYRSTGYYTDEISDKYIPYKNEEYHRVFHKSTRGLKIIVPFLRESFVNKDMIIQSICDSFMLAIINEDLVVHFNDITINALTFEDILDENNIFPETDNGKTDVFTKLYFRTYQNLHSDNFIISDKHQDYRFKLYFTYDESILTGRTGIYRSIGMKIEDKKIVSNVNKPYNALLIPYSVEEDVFLKSLENESHTKLDFSHFKDKENQENAKRFINNIDREISKVIESEMNKHNPPEGKLDTSDIIYDIENTFKRDIEKRFVELHIGAGNTKKTILKTSDTEEEGESTKRKKRKGKNKPNKLVKIKKDFGNEPKEYYQIPGSLIKRYSVTDKENLFINVDLNDIYEDKKTGNLLVTIVDGMGIEYPNEYNLENTYEYIADENTRTKLRFNKNCIYLINFEKGNIHLSMKVKNHSNKFSKLRFYLEV